MIRVVHIMERFNPMLGQEINVLSKNKGEGIDLYILTTGSLSLWNITDTGAISRMDKEYKEKYGVTVIRNPVLFEKGEKVWVKHLVRAIRTIDPDIVYSHGVEYLSFMRLLLTHGFTKRYTLVTDTHSLPQFATGSLFRKIFYSLLRRIIIPVVNRKKVICFNTAEENYDLLYSIYGIRKELIRPFLIGADLATFYRDAEAGARIRREHGIGDDDLVLLFTGRLCDAKAPHLIPAALDLLARPFPFRIHLILIGFRDENYMSRYEQAFRTGEKYRVILLPPVPAAGIRNYFSAADAAVYPAESTLSSLEAQACRLPVIMEDNPTNRKRCAKGGVLFTSGDTAGLAAMLDLLIREPGMRSKLSEEGFEYMRTNYDYLTNIRKMESELFNQVAKRKEHV